MRRCLSDSIDAGKTVFSLSQKKGDAVHTGGGLDGGVVRKRGA